MDGKKELSHWLSKALIVCTGLMFLMPIIPRGVRPTAIALLVILSIVTSLQQEQKFKWFYFLLNSGLFICYVISLLYTDDVAYGLKKLETGASIIVFPFLFAIMNESYLKLLLKNRFKFMWLFIMATVLLCLGSFLKFLQVFNFEEILVHYVNIIRTDVSGWNIHPIYLSMHIGISIIFSVFIIKKGVTLWPKIALVVMNLILIGFLMMVIKKGPIIALILVLGYLLLMLKSRNLYIIFGACAFLIIGTVILNPKANDKFSELLQIQDAETQEATSTDIRFSIYKCAVEILPEAGIFGYGVGDGKNKLLNCYQETSAFLAENRYNSHNQFLGIIIKVGFLGLLVFSLFLIYHMARAFDKRNYLLIAVTLFYCIVMFSENIMERENGILYFSFFVNFFIMINYNFPVKTSEDRDSLQSVLKK
ncbi:O-antigen ligase family protein [Nonlabens antarcticus]|uniref:O-antigen ligase family protein n=1 Tax=Nonlabens antarcticus TaxID=392714 RepID=UPI001E47A494|nr:O-antigen ligase family protein [Nonlabens antarcticus]